MRVITLNLNGIRSAHNKGAFVWLAKHKPDIVCLQEVRATETQIPELSLNNQAHWFPAIRPGYSGVGILSKQQPLAVVRGINEKEFDDEGRVLRLDFETHSVISAYLPSGSSGEERQAAKMRFLKVFLPHVQKLLKQKRELIVCGDFNIAHQKIDIKNWKSNQKSSGFLPEERDWMTEFLQLGLHDTYRELIGPDTAHYSWWSNRGNARANDVGWRLDYQISTPGLRAGAKKANIYREEFFSDHAPVMIDY